VRIIKIVNETNFFGLLYNGTIVLCTKVEADYCATVRFGKAGRMSVFAMRTN
jgi:hypothetical protein